jgi:glyoxylase-like metal-dependent hydrolase (beta-lactamase superfamily II)
MAECTVLIEGYARKTGDKIRASSTVCLIQCEGKKIITDPGCNRILLFQALDNIHLSPDDIDFVFLTHGHVDHFALCSLFGNAILITFDSGFMFRQDELEYFQPDCLGNDIRIISTPGHVEEHLSLLVDTPEGIIAIAGDVFWSYVGETSQAEQCSPDNPHKVWNPILLEQSREELLRLADFIVPGHGKIFPGNKSRF